MESSHRRDSRFWLFLFLAVLALAAVLIMAGCAGLPGRAGPFMSGAYIRPEVGEAERAVFAQYRDSILSEMQKQKIPGLALAVVDDQGILWKEGFGCTDTDCSRPVTPDTLFSVQSTSKSVTATAVMFAIQDGLVDLDTPITKYLPDFTVKSAFEERPQDKMTLRHLLSHTAGFTHDPPYGNNNDLGPYSLEKHIQSISDTWLHFPVGTAYDYSNIGPDLAAYIVQVRSGKPFHQYVQERLLAPLGISRSSFDQERVRRDPDLAIGHTWPYARAPFDMPFVGAGGFFASANEMAQFIRFHINRGAVDGKQILDAKLLDTMYSYHFDSAAKEDWYALGIAHNWIDNIPILTHNGGGVGFLCDMDWFPDLKLGIMLVTNSTDHMLQSKLARELLRDLVRAPAGVYHERLVALQRHFPSLDNLDATLRTISRAPTVSSLAPAPSAADKQRWASYAGSYRFKSWNLVGGVMPFVEKDGRMYLNDMRMEELRPGVFFTPKGEPFDLTGAEPVAWDGTVVDKAKNELTPAKQGLLGLCALVLASALLVPPGAWLVNRLRRGASASRAALSGRWTGIVLGVSALTAFAGLLFLAAVVRFPVLLYQDAFALNADLGLDVRFVLSLPFALGLGAILQLVFSIILWRRQIWPLPRRLHYAIVTLAALVLSVMVYGWNVIPFGF